MNKPAFSLVELMVTLIIISCIIAALTPAITKKLKTQGITLGATTIVQGGGGTGDSSLSSECSSISAKCTLCHESTCLNCTEKCAYNQALDTTACACQNCNTLIESNCEQCSTNACSKCIAGYYIAGGACVECPAGYKCDGINMSQCTSKTYALEGASECTSCTTNCTECDNQTGECTACEENYGLSDDNTCELASCGDLAMKITAGGQEMCITKFNAGDDALNFGLEGGGVLALPSTITTVSAGSGSCTPSTTKFCCWSGTTSTSCDSNNGGYSGCTRTVCDWRAANEFCSKLTYLDKTWQLPTSNEWASVGSQLSNLSIGQSTSGMMLCDYQSGYSSARCYNAERCSGSYDGYCYPNDVWSSDVSGSSAYYYYLNGGAWYGPYLCAMSYAFSVRCVSYL